MPAWRVLLSAAVTKDLATILQWTAERFGSGQAWACQANLESAIRALGAGPLVPGARDRSEIGPGLRTLHVARHGRRGRHLILFRAGPEHTIEVLRILHDQMDLARHLPDCGDQP